MPGNFFVRQLNFIISIFVTLVATSCGQDDVTGNWRRVDIPIDNTKSQRSQHQMGDLTLSNDSTFFIYGGGKPDIPNTPGWHSGGDLAGFWSMPSKNHIIFRIGKEDRFGTELKIIKLDESNLVIALTGDTTQIKYTRF